jgi:hypothetical protein
MNTRISIYHYDGGDGTHDTYEDVGYCVEDPAEVFKRLIKTHVIHKYKGCLYAGIQLSPSNTNGLIISEYDENEVYGIKVVGNLDNILKDKRVKAWVWDKFSKEELEKSMDSFEYYINRWYSDNKKYRDIYTSILNECKSICNEL